MLSCDECPFVTHSAYYLKSHKTNKHYNEGVIYRCELCPQVFVYPNSLYIHKKEIHDGIIYKCKLCGFISNSARGIKTHENQFHSNDDTEFFCGLCDKVIKDTIKRRHLEKHRKRKKKLKHRTFQCSKCDFKTDGESFLNKHNINKHSSNLIECNLCSFNTPYETKLEFHVLKEHKMKKCNKCDFETQFKDKMNYHQATIHDLECSECNF